MKAGVVYAPKDIRYEDIKKPVPQAGQVLIKVKYNRYLLPAFAARTFLVSTVRPATSIPMCWATNFPVP